MDEFSLYFRIYFFYEIPLLLPYQNQKLVTEIRERAAVALLHLCAD